MARITLPNHIRQMPSLEAEDIDLAPGVRVSQRKPNRLDLDGINRVIESATNTWSLPERLKRISLPLYRYYQDDVEHMQFLIAETKDSRIVGLAALEEVEATECPEGHSAWLLHGLYVNPSHHGYGIGIRLVESAEVITSANGFDGLLVKAQVDAQSFFENRGFTRLPVENCSRDYAYRYWKSICQG
ncbi:MAG: N-acetylglutamate synthase-like GNAT family acetyltransferase [Gammaproteobacteria bacterium]